MCVLFWIFLLKENRKCMGDYLKGIENVYMERVRVFMKKKKKKK